MTRTLSYGEDVTWTPGETAAFLIYNRMCGEQAREAFEASRRGQAFTPVPAPELAARARQMAA